MKSFDVPIHYRSPIINAIKSYRKKLDKLKKDFSPSFVKLDNIEIILARHFGFCYGVENAIEIAFKAINDNPNNRIFLLSEMIHNPQVNADLLEQGLKFIMDTKGNQLISWDELKSDDIVIVPAFGTTLEIEAILKSKNIQPHSYNTTCPFVEKVWNRSEKIGNDGYTIVVHGKPNHEETRATFSHSKAITPTVVVKDMEQTIKLSKYIIGEKDKSLFYEEFKGQYSEGFDVENDFKKIGVVNQTTMLASDTQGIADYLKSCIKNYYQLNDDDLKNHFAETRDTLCYATNDNQNAVSEMLLTDADIALVIGGYNSSNTTHLVELCESVLPTYFINDETCLLDNNKIEHFSLKDKKTIITENYTLGKDKVKIMITSGASCPDALVEKVIKRLVDLFDNAQTLEKAILAYE